MSVVTCLRCGAKNRVPAARTGRVRCAKCHTDLPWLVEADDDSFDAVVGEATLPVLVDVWAPWCGPCRAMAPMFERAAQQLEPRVRLLKLNSDAAPALSSRLGISGIPTLLLMHGGREIARHAGAMDARNIVAWTEAGLART